jgi:serralysin
MTVNTNVGSREPWRRSTGIPVIGHPGPSWHILGAGDYNGDGKSDILWQNDSGQASTWLMNGTTPVSEVLVGDNPGPSWHIHAPS